MDGDWDRYLEAFHRGQPGITEDLLRDARLDGMDPYPWLCAGVEAIHRPRRRRLLHPHRHEGAHMSDEQPAHDLAALVAAMVERLRREGTVPGIGVGEEAPSFSLPDAGGGSVVLDERLNEGPVVLSFYRGAWCPICNTELTALQQALPDLRARGARLIAVSPQAPDRSQELVQRLGLGFDVLSDLDQSVIRSYHLQFALDEDLRSVYRGFNMALDEHNADGTWNLPVPATFVIDQHRVVRARHVDPNYRERMHVENILSALDGIAARQP